MVKKRNVKCTINGLGAWRANDDVNEALLRLNGACVKTVYEGTGEVT